MYKTKKSMNSNNPQLRFMDYLDKSVKLPKNITVGTDCSGIEAPIQALELMNIKPIHIFSCDNDKDVRESIKANYSPRKLYDDITKRNHKQLDKVDLYVAGFPCQAFSLLGKRMGFEDQIKGTIFFECWETIKAIKPKIFILENVAGLVNHDKGNTLKIIKECLAEFKEYNIYYETLNTIDYGLPQNRSRLFIIGLKKPYFKTFKIPKKIPLNVFVEDLVDYGIPETTIYGDLTSHKINLLDDLIKLGKIDDFNEPWCVNLNVSSVTRTNPMKHVCPCLLAGSGGNCIYYLTSIRRRLTPREYLRLQGFPDNFSSTVSDSKLYKQVGNSMSTSVLVFIFQEIFRAIKQ